MSLRFPSFRFIPAVLCIWVSFSAASPAESTRRQSPGKVVVASVVKKVDAIDPKRPSPRLLSDRDIISEKNTVKADVASTATLVFSNGATFNVLESSSLVITEFLQDPFSTPFAMPVATEEPTTSTTKLNLTSGEVVCKVKKLRTEQGSSLTIVTPVGAAGVRGTTFAISYIPSKNGTDKGTYTLSVTEGEVSFTDNDGNVTIVGAGKELVVSFRTGTDPVTGAVTVVEILGKQVRNIPGDRLNTINQVAAKGEVDAKVVIFESTVANVLNTMPAFGTPITPVNPTPVDPAVVTEVNPRSNSDQ